MIRGVLTTKYDYQLGALGGAASGFVLLEIKLGAPSRSAQSP
jgi:hypothetical protein